MSLGVWRIYFGPIGINLGIIILGLVVLVLAILEKFNRKETRLSEISFLLFLVARATKFDYVNFYDAFARIMGISWQKPAYKPTEKLPFVPQEKHIDQLIYSAGKKMAAIRARSKRWLGESARSVC